MYCTYIHNSNIYKDTLKKTAFALYAKLRYYKKGIAYFCRISGHSMDIERAVNGCQSNKPIIVLAHNPGATKKMIDRSKRKIDLIISG